MDDLDKILKNEEIKKAIETFKKYANMHIDAIKKNKKNVVAKSNISKIGG